MAHHNNSNSFAIKININEDLKQFLILISERNPKSELCQAKLAEFFMKYGIYKSFTEEFRYDLGNFSDSFKYLKRLVEGNNFKFIISDVIERQKERERNIRNKEEEILNE
jgi:hypothetical protein